MIPESQKFLFNRSFDVEKVSEEVEDTSPVEEIFEPEIPDPVYTDEDIKIAHHEGIELGKSQEREAYEKSQATTEKNIKEETKIALESILKELSRLKDSQKAIDLSAQEAAIRVSQAILYGIHVVIRQGV